MEDLSHLKSLGIGGLLGVLVGLLALVWIEPTTDGGAYFIIVICTILGCVAGELLKLISGKNGS